MTERILAVVFVFIKSVIAASGYGGVALLMGIESACIPLPSELIMPCDLHVDRVARKLNLITRKQTDWQTAVELTQRLREFDPSDPVKYDFALFGLGIEEKF